MSEDNTLVMQAALLEQMSAELEKLQGVLRSVRQGLRKLPDEIEGAVGPVNVIHGHRVVRLDAVQEFLRERLK